MNTKSRKIPCETSLICTQDHLTYDFVIANTAKEAKKLMMSNLSEWIYNEPDAILNYYAKWHKGADITGLIECEDKLENGN